MGVRAPVCLPCRYRRALPFALVAFGSIAFFTLVHHAMREPFPENGAVSLRFSDVDHAGARSTSVSLSGREWLSNLRLEGGVPLSSRTDEPPALGVLASVPAGDHEGVAEYLLDGISHRGLFRVTIVELTQCRLGIRLHRGDIEFGECHGHWPAAYGGIWRH